MSAASLTAPLAAEIPQQGYHRVPRPMRPGPAPRRLEILFLYSRPPLPMTRGDELTVSHLLEFLHSRGHAVDFVTLIEPGGYATDWGGSSARHAASLDAYDTVREQAANRPSRRGTPGDPVATRDAVLTLVDAEEPPLRVFFGEQPLGIATADYESRLATWNRWQPLSVAAHGGRRG